MARKKKKPKRERVSASTVELRVQQITDMRINGAEFDGLWRFVSVSDPEIGKKPWKISKRTLERYIAQSKADISKYVEKDRAVVLDMHIRQSRNLYARAIDQGDVKAALAVLKNEAELYSLYPQKLPPLESALVAIELLNPELGKAIRRGLAAPVPPAGSEAGDQEGSSRSGVDPVPSVPD